MLDEGDDLGYSIDETTGMCDLTIYFDGNALARSGSYSRLRAL